MEGWVGEVHEAYCDEVHTQIQPTLQRRLGPVILLQLLTHGLSKNVVFWKKNEKKMIQSEENKNT